MLSRKTLLALCLLIVARVAESQAVDSTASPFAGFETRILRNGLKVWFKQAKGMPDVSVNVFVPVGSGDDPEGLEQLAHFTEHLAFSGSRGRTEEQIKRALSDRGGIYNATTRVDQTHYWTYIPRQHGLFAVDWIYGVIEPKALRPADIARQRDPVLIEVGAQPAGVGLWLLDHVVAPRALRPASTWKREFGLVTGMDRQLDMWKSVHAIDSATVRRFYDRYYAPAGMTLLIVGDLPAADLWQLIDTTYATLPARPLPPPRRPLIDPRRERSWFTWLPLPTNGYSESWKTYGRSAHRNVVLIFLARYLNERLNDRLRFGTDSKSVYGLSVGSERYGEAAMFRIRGDVKQGSIDRVRAVIDSEIDQLRMGTVPDSQFTATKDAVLHQLLATTTTSSALASLATAGFYDRSKYADFPNILAEWRSLSRQDVAEVVRETFVRERHVVETTRVLPIPMALIVLLGVIAAWGGVRLAHSTLVRPLPMVRLRYMARLRRSPTDWVSLLLGIAVALVVYRLALFLLMIAAEHWVLTVNSFTWQLSVALAAIAASLLFWCCAASLVPSKVLLFDEGLAIKAKSFRSRWIAWSAVEAAHVEQHQLAPAVRLTLRSGRTEWMRTRDCVELAEMIAALRSARPLTAD